MVAAERSRWAQTRKENGERSRNIKKLTGPQGGQHAADTKFKWWSRGDGIVETDVENKPGLPHHNEKTKGGTNEEFSNSPEHRGNKCVIEAD